MSKTADEQISHGVGRFGLRYVERSRGGYANYLYDVAIVMTTHYHKQQSSTNMASIITEDILVIPQGRTCDSLNAQYTYGGHRYSKDGKPLKSGYKSWIMSWVCNAFEK